MYATPITAARRTRARTTRESIEAARLAQLVEHYEREGWPLALVRLLDRHPDMTLADALEGFTIPARRLG